MGEIQLVKTNWLHFLQFPKLIKVLLTFITNNEKLLVVKDLKLMVYLLILFFQVK